MVAEGKDPLVQGKVVVTRNLPTSARPKSSPPPVSGSFEDIMSRLKPDPNNTMIDNVKHVVAMDIEICKLGFNYARNTVWPSLMSRYASA